MLKSEALTVTSTASRLHKAVNGHSDAPEGVVLYVNSGGPIYVGGSDVTTTNGMPVAIGQYFSLDLISSEEVWAVAAGSSNVRLLRTRV